MNFHTLLRVFLKWFLIGQGIIWSFLTLYITLSGIDVQGQGIAFAWVIAILFGLLMSFEVLRKTT